MVSEFFTSHAKQQDWELLPFPSPPAAYSVNKKALANATKLGFCLFFFFFPLQKSQNYAFLYVYAQVQLEQDSQFQQLR